MGKTPTVALIRQHTDRSVVIPDIIRAIQRWKSNPKQDLEEEPVEPEKPCLTLEERVLLLEKQVAQLLIKIENLSTLPELK